MKSKFSRKWVSSTQPRKQRKYRANAPLHARHSMVSAHMSPSLRKHYGKRSMPLRVNDEVEVKTGEFKGIKGKIQKVNLKKLKVYVDNVKKSKTSGQEVAVFIDPSNLMITALNMEDTKRKKIFSRKNPAAKMDIKASKKQENEQKNN